MLWEEDSLERHKRVAFPRPGHSPRSQTWQEDSPWTLVLQEHAAVNRLRGVSHNHLGHMLQQLGGHWIAVNQAQSLISPWVDLQ